MTTIDHDLLYIVLWRFSYCYANATAILPISKMLTGGKKKSQPGVIIRVLLMSSFCGPLNCFNGTFSSA